MKAKKVLFGTSAWGLGHATRDLVLIRGLLSRGCEVTIVSTGRALRVLKQELGDSCRYLDWPDIPTTVAKTGFRFYVKTAVNIPRIIWTWIDEQRRFKQLLREERFDVIISDHRNGLVTSDIPSYYITHSPRYIAPWRDPVMEWAMERALAHWLKPMRKIIIPDDADGGMSGDMSHRIRFTPPERLVYIGILSSVRRRDDLPQDIDYFITISGPEPQRTLLEEKVLAQVSGLDGRIVIALGKPDEDTTKIQLRKGIEVYPYLDRAHQEEMLNRAKLVVCRSGYTTLMELAEIGRKALIIPTPGQSEQEYLAKTLRSRGIFYSVKQNKLNLVRDTEIARSYPGYTPAHTTEESVHRFLEAVLGEEK